MIEEAHDLDEITRFFQLAWPDDPLQTSATTIAWRYSRGQHLVWRKGGSIVGHLGILAVTVDAGEAAINAAWLLDWIVLPAHRGGAGGMTIMKEANSRFDLTMAVGLTPRSEAIFRRTGWRDAGLLDRCVKVLSPLRIVRAKTPFPPSRKRPITVKFDPPTIAPPPNRIHVRRDAAYLTARYAVPTPWPHLAIGSTIWSIRDRPDGIRQMSLLEGRDIGAAAIDVARQNDCDLIDISGRGILPPAGWKQRKGLRFMWKWNAAAPAPDILYDDARWYITRGDSDQDR